MLTVGSLFAGVGGFDLGLERAGMRVIWQSEIDPHASAVLRKHWPDVPNFGDVRGITAKRLRFEDRARYGLMGYPDIDNGGARRTWRPDPASEGKQFTERTFSFPDVICGGFPCQDISNAGKRAGIDGERSGLWSEFARIIGELRPRYVIVENVAALLGRGLERVLGDLAALGFDAEWHCIPASAVGAPHRRDRLWIIAYANSKRLPQRGECDSEAAQPKLEAPQRYDASRCGSHVADTDQPRLEGRLRASLRECDDQWAIGESGALENAGCIREGRRSGCGEAQGGRSFSESTGSSWWLSEPDVGRVAHGVPSRVDRLRCLGNAIVPQIAEIIGRAIVSAHESR